jgi:TP901 family phage tail tape measure protein
VADEIRTSLGFEAAQAIQELSRLQRELEAYNNAIRAAAESTRAFNRAGRALDKVLSSTADNLNKLSAAARGVASSNKQINTAAQGYSQIVAGVQGVTDVTGKAEAQTQGIAKTMSDTGQIAARSFATAADAAKALGIEIQGAGNKGAVAGKSVLLSWQSVVRIFAIQTIHRGITLVTNAFVDGIGAAVDYQTALAEIQTIGGSLDMSMGELSETVRSISEEFAQPLDVVTEGLYQTLSNQVADGAQNLEFLATANKFATAAVTDSASAVNLLSATLNSYNLSAAEAADVAGKLFKTIELGRIRGEEFSDTFGRVTVLTGQLGISLDEVLTALATLTVTGLKYNEAFTLINNTTLKLIRPTEELQKVYNKMGIASAEAGIQAFGFQGFLVKLTEVSGDTATEIGELFNRIRAIRGILGLTGNQADKFAENFREIEKASKIDLEKAFATVFDTDAKRLVKELVKIKNIFTDTFGTAAVKDINAFFSAFGGGPETLQALSVALTATGAAYALFSTGIITSNFRIIGSFTGLKAASLAALTAVRAFVATPLGAALAIGTAFFAATAALNRFTEANRESAEEQKKNDQIVLRSIQDREIERRKAVSKSEQEILSDAQKFLFERQKLYNQDAETAQRLQDAAFGSIADQVENRLGAYSEFVEKVREHSEGARDAIRDLNKEVLSASDKLQEFDFERSLSGLNDQQKSWRLIQESQQRVFESNKALANGDKERAKTLAEQAESLAKQAASTAQSSSNVASIRKANDQVRASLAQQLQLRQSALQQEQNAISAANKIRAEEEARKVRIDAIQKRLEDLTKILEDNKLVPDFDESKTQAEINRFTALLKAEGDAAGKNMRILENYDPDVKKIREKFEAALRDPLTGAKIDIIGVFDINFNRIMDILRQQAESIPESKKIAIEKLTGAKIGVAGPGDAQVGFTKVDDDTKRAEKAVLDLNIANTELSAKLIDVRKSLVDAFGSAQTASLRAFGTESEGWLGTLDTVLGAVSNSTDKVIDTLHGVDTSVLDRMIEQFGDLPLKLVEFGTAAEKALSPETLDPKRAADMALELAKLANTAQAAGYEKLAGQIRDAALAIQQAITAAKDSAELKTVAETLTPLEQRVKDTGAEFNNLGTEASNAGTEAVSGANSATNAVQAQMNAVNALTEAYKRQAQAAAAGKGKMFGGMILKSFGGLIPKIDYRALGGPVGTDSILTGLTAGESVNTVDATRRFFPQIQAMNSGVTPQFRSEGGEVNHNFGDVNIEVTEATNARETAREVMKQIKRESRRQTFNLRRT